MMAGLEHLGQGCFLLGLLVTHFILFGLPSIETYLEGAVTVEESEEKAEALLAPAVTLCPYENNFIGWKNFSQFLPVYQPLCGHTSAGGILRCIEERTFNWTETLPGGGANPMLQYGAQHGFQADPSLHRNIMKPEFWITQMTNSYNGRCYTLNYTERLASDVAEDALVFNLNPNLRYYFYLHQLHLFMLTFNPMAMPTTDLVLEPQIYEGSHMQLTLQVVR